VRDYTILGPILSSRGPSPWLRFALHMQSLVLICVVYQFFEAVCHKCCHSDVRAQALCSLHGRILFFRLEESFLNEVDYFRVRNFEQFQEIKFLSCMEKNFSTCVCLGSECLIIVA
jgi:hypothetical protein